LKNILISFVGNHDPYGSGDTEGPLLTLAGSRDFDDIYLFPSGKMPGCSEKDCTEGKAREACSLLEKKYSHPVNCYVYPLILDDPTDFAQILQEMKKYLSQIIDHYKGGKVCFNLNCTSGTQQMSACAYVVANAGYIPGVKLWQVRNPHVLKGKGSENAERVIKIKSHFVEEENILSRIRQYLGEFNFSLLGKECQRLENISAYLERKGKARLAGSVFNAWHLWDCMQFRGAQKQLQGVRDRIEDTVGSRDLIRIIDKQAAFLEKIIQGGEKENAENLTEIYFNALRCNARGSYFDVLARTWRICEGILYYRLRENWEIDPRNPLGSPDRELGRNIADHLGASQSNNINNSLNITKADIVLKQVIKDEVYMDFMKSTSVSAYEKRSTDRKEVTLDSLRDTIRKQRNSSIIAHGMEPVRDLDARNCIVLTEAMLKKFVKGSGLLFKDYPLLPKYINVLTDFLAE